MKDKILLYKKLKKIIVQSSKVTNSIDNMNYFIFE